MKYLFLCLPFVVSGLFWGGVHTLSQITIAIAVFIFPAILIWNKRPRINGIVFWAMMGFFSLFLITSIPVPIVLHEALFPGASPQLNISFQLLGLTSYPLNLNPFEHLSTLVIGALACLVIITSAQILKATKDLNTLAQQLLLFVASFIVLGVLQRLTNAPSIYWISDIPQFAKRQFFASWIYPNHAAVVMAMTFPLVLALSSIRLRWILSALWLLGLTCAQSRGGWLAAYVGIMAFGLLTWRKRYAAILPIGIVINGLLFMAYGMAWFSKLSDLIRYTPTEALDSGRQEIWRDNIDLLTAAPVTGSGYGSIEDLVEMTRASIDFSRFSHLHQEPMEILISHGLLIGSALLVLWLWILIRGLKLIQRLKPQSKRYMVWLSAFWSGLIALSIHSCVDLSFRSQAVVLLAALFLGPFCASRKKIFRYAGNLPSILIFVFGILTIYLHKMPDSRYSFSDHWISQSEKSQGGHAIRSAQHAALGRPLFARAFRHWGVHIYEKDPQKGLALIAHASQLAPQNFINWMALADAYTRQEDCPKAWKAWRSAASLQMESLQAFKSRIPLMFSCGAIEDAAEIIDSSIPRQQVEIAFWLGQQGHWPIGEKKIRGAVSEAPELDIFAATYFYNAQDYPTAWSFVASKTVQNCQWTLTQAKILLALYHPIEAESYYHDAQKYCGHKDTIQAGLNTARIQQGYKEALEKAQIQINENPKMHSLRRHIMNGISLTEDHAALIPHYEKLFEYNQLTVTEQVDLIHLYSGQKSQIWPKTSPLPQ